MIETGVLLDWTGAPIFWHIPLGRTGGSLPDSQLLWEKIWDNRATVGGFAHTHPGRGIPGPSYEDVTTFSGIELALGKRLDWWILSEDHAVLLRWVGPKPYQYGLVRSYESLPFGWVTHLRAMSGYGGV